MKTVSVFEFADYKGYIKAWISTRPGRGRGEKSRIAQALKCHSAYISQVLEHSAQLSLEQASDLNDYLNHDSREARFFILLVQRERSGSKSLTRHFEAQIQEILEARLSLQNRLEFKKVLSQEDQATYYSAWYYAAIHMLVSLPELQTREALASYLRLPGAKISEVLSFLVKTGLVSEASGRFASGPASIHLEEDSPLRAQNSANWRFRAIQSMDAPKLNDLHYNSVATLNERDLPKVRSILVKAIEDVRAVVKPSSPENAVFCYCLDLFRI